MFKTIKNETEAAAFGVSIGEKLKPGAVVGLVGDLGAGKTTLVKAIARGLEIEEEVTSPTFTIMRVYEGGRLPLYHFDVYRLSSPEELRELDYEDYFYGDGVTVVEWADLVETSLPEDAIIINIEYCQGENPNTEERIYSCHVDPCY
ncbi:MAG: tRNA (adenosine(37)-N6)-threonylcarbamoyltransferase complex ATPase subunit type 1 TsaE [Clostridiales Family XIII bacterium]|nr:tRNA (adenosine(37)-N6)-threonylcarbamoyltransferase complex ATPase subunit type 1 TsaE [Clostridiales Family XIII bacterium]